MAKLVRLFDPNETERRINLVIQEDACPGLLEFLASMPHRTETPLLRGVIYQWFVMNRDADTLDEAIQAALEGSGGLLKSHSGTAAPKKQGPGRPRTRAIRTPRAIAPRPVAKSKAPQDEPPANPDTPARAPTQSPVPAPEVGRNETPAVADPDVSPVTSSPAAGAVQNPPQAIQPAIDADAMSVMDSLDSAF
ncbi:hypothetical protein [Burkholderia gladioli]|uniref:hypothetical protein n=1 Tax=Burkholderia gladioli TaxID=28095 RepID=UPI00164126CD|nr:hypothetical protein [Burkholderia gladioli]